MDIFIITQSLSAGKIVFIAVLVVAVISLLVADYKKRKTVSSGLLNSGGLALKYLQVNVAYAVWIDI